MDKASENPYQDKPAAQDVKPPRAQTGPKVPRKITEKYLYNAALAYLQRFPTSTPNFIKVMERKIKKSCTHHTDQDYDTCRTLLDKTIQDMTRLGLLNDAAYLQGMVNSLRRRGLSQTAITAKLATKGYKSPDILEALSVFDADMQPGTQDNPELVAALLCARRKKLGCFSRKSPTPELRQKNMAALARYGFSYDVVSKVLAMEEDEAAERLSAIRL